MKSIGYKGIQIPSEKKKLIESITYKHRKETLVDDDIRRLFLGWYKNIE